MNIHKRLFLIYSILEYCITKFELLKILDRFITLVSFLTESKKGANFVPAGILINVFFCLLGGIVGGLVGERISEKFKQEINMVSGACSMAMGIYAIAL